MVDLLGPDGAARAVTTRPTEISPGTVDTYFADCIQGVAGTGTPISAQWLNRVMAQARALIRSCVGSVAENNADDYMLTRAVRSQRMNWLTAGGTANAITLAPSPAFAALSETVGAPLGFLVTATNTGAVTLNVNALGAVAVTWPDGSALVSGDLAVGAVAHVVFDGTAFRLRYCLSPTQVKALTAISSRRQVYATPGVYTYTVPAGVTSVKMRGWGGGGGGGASADGTSGSIAGNAGAGGGGGGYTEKVHAVTPGSTITVTVGAKGAGVTNAAGTAGGTTSFGAICSATGGGGGGWGTNTNTPGGAGGSGVGGDINLQGSDGGFAASNVALGSAATQSDAQRIYNKGGMAPGGYSVVTLGGTGAAGRGFGAGGGGASGGSGVIGGNGADGLAIIEW